ncbi:hypothetical protein BDV95DRAFT_575088 [Massariosphaeria phaeospora]|uniref:Glycosyltransferase family 31 protein n=1 Tax=Massariosphaeria phaeospora TaxID=100035 RepID=A0A7C8I3P9_9PLEO|nr:hypothetical protein BDV95DRAFT_575088 [Massariosphaeria phaeospora]
MPLLTPSRLAVLVLSLSLLTFLWTLGLPHQLATPSLPIIHHETPDYKPLPSRPANPAVVPPEFPTVTPPRPSQFDNDNGESGEDSDVPFLSGEDGEGRPYEKENKPTGSADEDKPTESGKGEEQKPLETSTRLPTTLKTELVASSTATNGSGAALPSPSSEPLKPCTEWPGASDVMVVVKTSKAEAYEKIPTHLLTLLSCVPNFVIFSDHAGEIDGHPVHDALDTITDSAKAAHDEFREYEQMQSDMEYKPSVDRTKALDKWKILPMVYKAFQMRPHQKFYIFIEADTSLSWTNLLQWLVRLDYRIPYYSGAPTYLNRLKFAQRGSGILLSNGAMQHYSYIYEERYESHWEAQVGKGCCGDTVLSTALSESHVEFYSAWPLLQGETLATLDWSKKHWCVPIVSWHHVSSAEIDILWAFQRNWTRQHGSGVPYLFINAFEELVVPHLEEVKHDWDNMSRDTKIVGKDAKAKAEAEEAKKQAELEEEQKADALKIQALKDDASETNTTDPKAEPSEVDESEAEPSKVNESETDAPKSDKSKVDKTKTDALKPDKSKADAPKVDAHKISAPKPSSSKTPTPKTAAKPARPKPAPPSPVGPNSNRPRADLSVSDKTGDAIKAAADSVENCAALCQKADDCVQWKHTAKGNGECHLGKVVRLGKKVEKKEGEPGWTSGWVVERVEKVREEWMGKCEEPRWRFNQY